MPIDIKSHIILRILYQLLNINVKQKKSMLIFDDRHILEKYQIRKVMIIILCRLSTIAGSKLTHNNPGIADLSDKNRPQKLGEYFSELYDNEWTEAVSGLTEGHGEEVAIQLLRDVLKVKVQKELLIMLGFFFSFFQV